MPPWRVNLEHFGYHENRFWESRIVWPGLFLHLVAAGEGLGVFRGYLCFCEDVF